MLYETKESLVSKCSVVNIYIVYELKMRTVYRPTFTVQNPLCGAIKITKSTDNSKYSYGGYGIRFDAKSDFTTGNITNGQNVTIFGVDMPFSSHSNNRANNIYVLGKDFIQGINGTTIYAEKLYKTDPTEKTKKIVLSLHYNGDNSYLFVNGIEQLKFKAKRIDNDIKATPLSLGNIRKDWDAADIIKTSLYGNVHDFAIDYVSISGVKKIYDIHRYLMKKHNI